MVSVPAPPRPPHPAREKGGGKEMGRERRKLGQKALTRGPCPLPLRAKKKKKNKKKKKKKKKDRKKEGVPTWKELVVCEKTGNAAVCPSAK